MNTTDATHMLIEDGSQESTDQLARRILYVPGVMTTVISLILDSNHTHLFHEQWPPHARFHAGLLICVAVGLGLTSLWMLRTSRLAADGALRLRVAALLPGVFWSSFIVCCAIPSASPHIDGFPHTHLPPGNVIVASILGTLCAYAVWRDARRRRERAARR